MPREKKRRPEEARDDQADLLARLTATEAELAQLRQYGHGQFYAATQQLGSTGRQIRELSKVIDAHQRLLSAHGLEIQALQTELRAVREENARLQQRLSDAERTERRLRRTASAAMLFGEAASTKRPRSTTRSGSSPPASAESSSLTPTQPVDGASPTT